MGIIRGPVILFQVDGLFTPKLAGCGQCHVMPTGVGFHLGCEYKTIATESRMGKSTLVHVLTR